MAACPAQTMHVVDAVVLWRRGGVTRGGGSRPAAAQEGQGAGQSGGGGGLRAAPHRIGQGARGAAPNGAATATAKQGRSAFSPARDTAVAQRVGSTTRAPRQLRGAWQRPVAPHRGGPPRAPAVAA